MISSKYNWDENLLHILIFVYTDFNPIDVLSIIICGRYNLYIYLYAQLIKYVYLRVKKIIYIRDKYWKYVRNKQNYFISIYLFFQSR